MITSRALSNTNSEPKTIAKITIGVGGVEISVTAFI